MRKLLVNESTHLANATFLFVNASCRAFIFRMETISSDELLRIIFRAQRLTDIISFILTTHDLLI